MNIQNEWNSLNYSQKLILIERQLEVTRDITKIAKLDWNNLYNIEKKQIRMIYTYKSFNISFELECNNIGAIEIRKQFYKFMQSKDWNFEQLKINWK